MRSRTPSLLLLSSASLLAWPAIADDGPCCAGGHCADGVCHSECDCDDCGGHCCPPPDLEGCTPGYWKQEHHFDSWPADLAPEDLFVDVFGVDAFPGLTLLDVLDQGGGGLIALGRHSVAALLNSLTADVNFEFTDGDVLDGFEHAWDSGSFTKMKNNFEDANEDGCPLN